MLTKARTNELWIRDVGAGLLLIVFIVHLLRNWNLYTCKLNDHYFLFVFETLILISINLTSYHIIILYNL